MCYVGGHALHHMGTHFQICLCDSGRCLFALWETSMTRTYVDEDYDDHDGDDGHDNDE